jgi:hypothetical protein
VNGPANLGSYKFDENSGVDAALLFDHEAHVTTRGDR